MVSKSKTKVSRSATKINVDDVVFNGVSAMVSRVRKGKSWTGTMTDLNAGLVSTLGTKSSSTLPGSPSALRTVLNRVVNRLRNRKISVKFGRTTDHNRTRYVKFSR